MTDDKKIGPHERQLRALREAQAWQREQERRKAKQPKGKTKAVVIPIRPTTGKGRGK